MRTRKQRTTTKQPANLLRHRIGHGVVFAGVLSLSFAMSASAGERFARDRVLVPFMPAAMAEGPSAMRYNTAAIGVQRGLALDYYHTFTDSSLEGDDAVYFSSSHVGFSAEWLGSSVDVADGRAYTVGLSNGSDGSLLFGTSYQWRSSDDPAQDKSHFWAHSALWRPNDWLSLAAVADNHNRMKDGDGRRTDAEFVYSAAINLLDGRLRVGGDWYQTTSERVKDGTYRLAASMEIHDGLTAFADIDEDENYFLGARLDMTSFFVGSHAGFDRGDGYYGGVMYAGLSQERRAPITTIRREVVHLNLSGDIPDRRPPRRFFGPNPPTTLDWVNLLDKAGNDPDVRAVVITISNPSLGWARLDELRRAVLRLRGEGKYTVVYLDEIAGNGEYYFATAADQIVAPPVSTVNLLGLRSEVTFAKRLLDKIGVNADLEHIGDYKTASDLLTRSSMSPAHREALGTLLDDFDGHFRGDIATARGVDAANVAGWIDHGPFISVDASNSGLIDRVAYPDELDDIVREAVGAINSRVSGQSLAKRFYRNRQWGPTPRVAVIFAEGSILNGADREEFAVGRVMGAESVGRAIRHARNDRRVKAVVLRVNSGGGSVFASDRIWHEVAETVGKKPVVVSFADVAASGGYYIACAADSIFALPNTVTGSIGIINGKLDLSGLYDKIGIDKEVETRGRFADLYGTTRSFKDEERAIVREQMQSGYERFLDLVSEGRALSVDSVDAIGQGRVWSGQSAESLGLVDRQADLHEVIGTAARMAGVPPGRSISVEVLPRPGWKFFDFDLPGSALLAAGPLSEVLRLTGLGAGVEGPAYAMPYYLTID